MIKGLYVNLLGYCSPQFVAIDQEIVSRGPLIFQLQYQGVVKPFLVEELHKVMLSIGMDKSPSMDGLNYFFYGKVWHLIKNDVYSTYLHFFECIKMPRGLNCIAITLISKVVNPSYPYQFRPISYCNVLYKLIPKCLLLDYMMLSPQ